MRDQVASKRGIIIVVALFIVMLVYAVNVAGIPRLIGNIALSGQPYVSNSTVITAQVDSDTALNVTEQREFTFTSKTTCIRWKHDALTSDSEITMHGLRVSVLDSDGNAVESYELTAVPFKKEWRETNGSDGVGPGQPCYAIDDMNSTVYTFFDAENATVVFTVDYTVESGLRVWRDVTELNWTVLSGNWPMDTKNLSVSLQLPVAANAIVSPGKNVNAWSHGPQNGTLEVTESGVVLYESAVATAGQWASLHITFPSVWITNLPDTAIARQNVNELHQNASENSEKDWVDSSTAAQVRGSKFDILVLGLPLVVLVVGVALFLRFGRDRKPQQTCIDDARAATLALHPAVLGRLARWNRQDERDLAASIVGLVQKGLVLMEEPHEEGETPRLVKTDQAAEDETDSATLTALFEGVAGGAESVTLSEVAAFANDNKDAFCETVAAWNHKLDHRVDELGYFDKKSFSWQVRLFLLAALLLIIGVTAKVLAGSDVLFGASLPVACVIALLANYTPRRTQEGQNLAACADATKDELFGLTVEDTKSLDDEPALALVALQLCDLKARRKPALCEKNETAALYSALVAALASVTKN